MELESSDSSPVASPVESVIVVMNANRNKVSVEALDWAIKHVVRPRDTVIVLGVLSDFGKKTCSSSSTCLPFHMRISLSGISVRVEFSGQDEMSPRKLEDKIEKKKEDYQCTFHSFYRQCKKNDVKLEVKLAAGYDPRKITIEEAQHLNPRWIVLESYLKKHKIYIYGHVACNVAVMKEKGIVTLMPSRTSEHDQQWPTECGKVDDHDHDDHEAFTGASERDIPLQDEEPLNAFIEKTCVPAPTPQSPCWYPLSWRTAFPRAFTINELEAITNGFAIENLVEEEPEVDKQIFEGICQETPVLVKRFAANDDQFWSVLKILSRVRHRNILNLVGYCCTDASVFLLFDYPCSGTIEMNLICDESAKRLSWRVRWYIALEIGIGLRYLHEECVDGPIADLCVCSPHVVFSHGSSVMLSIFNSTPKWIKDDNPCKEDSPADRCMNNTEDQEKRLWGDVNDYGIFLIELITGKSARLFQKKKGLSLIDWAIPYLENGSLNQVMDPRLMEMSNDSEVVNHIARAALLCLNNDARAHKFSISEVLAVVRGDQFAATSW
ncbi:putative LRR receptor-like serine/threonine-protein kinase [Camellia lanceoleosa]|uniref:LRR receptor-like serine/threonine-protein kinase n=1 Tax=Camellia lanceoleosa TaxID=1840588 RepID=A0ACC0FW41_9ERIC|nr:putative LRR receptor-like serine/threonine-protein kinase [Camellia lanceoleosa]